MKTKAPDRNDKLALVIKKFISEHFKKELDFVLVNYNHRKKVFIIKISYSKTLSVIATLSTNFKLYSRITSVFNISNFKVDVISIQKKFY